jgi:hypothetical protein
MYELWRPIPGWEGLYEASSLGRVRSLPRDRNGRTYGGRLLTAVLNPRYYAVRLRDSGTGRSRSESVHALVAAAFLGPRPKGMVVRHGPGGCLDNSIANLSYGTQQENIYDKRRDGTWLIGDTAARRILHSSEVAEIYQSSETSPALAARYGVSETTIRKIWAGKNWRSVTRQLPQRAVRSLRLSLSASPVCSSPAPSIEAARFQR